MPISAVSLVKKLNGSIASNNSIKECEIEGISPLETASSNHLCFLEGKTPSKKILEQISNTNAGLIFAPMSWQQSLSDFGQIAYFDDPVIAFIYAQQHIPELNVKLKYTAPKIGATTKVHPTAVIDDGVQIGEGGVVGPNVYIAQGVVIGDEVRIDANVVLYERVRIGNNCRIMANTTIGSDGFGWRPDNGKWVYFPQIGGVHIGDDVHIGANITIDCGTMEPTRIGKGVLLDNQIHIAHNCEIGDYTAIAGCTGIAGSTKIGTWCLIGGSADILGHITIGDYCTIQGTTFVSKDMPSGSKLSSALPGKEPRQWAKTVSYINRLEELNRRLKELEKE